MWGDIRKREPTALVKVGDESHPAIGALFQFHRSYTYFGRIPMSLGSAPPDPLTVLVVDSLPIRRTISIVRGLVGERGLGVVKGFTVIEGATEATLTSVTPLEVQSDGELLGTASRVRVIHKTDRLRVATPQSPR